MDSKGTDFGCQKSQVAVSRHGSVDSSGHWYWESDRLILKSVTFTTEESKVHYTSALLLRFDKFPSYSSWSPTMQPQQWFVD